MTKKTATITALLINTMIAIAQESANTGAFTELKATNKIYIELIESSEDKIEFVTGSIKDLNIDNSNGKLLIKNNIKTYAKQGEFPLKIKVYAKNLKNLNVENGSYIFSNDVIKNSLKIEANLGSIVELDFQTNSVEINANSGAQVVLKGTINNLIAHAATSSTISAKNIQNQSAVVTVNTGGVIDIHSTGNVDAQTKAGGTINLYGSPKSLQQKINFGGTINIKSL